MSIQNTLRRHTRAAYSPHLVVLVIGIGVAGLGMLLSPRFSTSSDSLLRMIPLVLGVGGVALILSSLLSIGSAVGAGAQAERYWDNTIRVAVASPTYGEFVEKLKAVLLSEQGRGRLTRA